ncbi:MAG: alpha-maltose-phosphate synthase [Solirubrobacteraceae bacterium]|jgi:glycosyltransferase involved in cell wall biosynthesis|nr:alpha-maltose-phosphate synthase [Solirubrobacteraceae bacterium]
MRILIASDHYPPFVGGVQRQTRALALELLARGHSVCVATVWQDDLPAFEDRDGFEVHRLRQLRSAPFIRGRSRRRHQPPFPDPVTAVALRRLIRRLKPDLVHGMGWFSYSAAAALVGTRIPLVASAREYGLSCANASLLHDGAPCSGPGPVKCLGCSARYFGTGRGTVAYAGVRVSAPLLRRKVTAIHSVSRYVRDIVARDFLRGAAERVPQTVISPFRLEEDAAPDEAFLARLPHEPFLLFVGALRRAKGVEQLYEAYAGLEDPPPLVLLGTTEWDVVSDPPPGVHALGSASNATVLAAWDRSLFGVMPSLWPEPFGSVVHEAMSRGRAVIGTTPGGHEDMIEHERTGLLVAPGDVGELRAALRRLIEDAPLRTALGRRARERAALFTAEHALPQFEALYRRHAGRGHGRVSDHRALAGEA